MFKRPSAPPDEYAIVMLKPDAFARGVDDEIVARVRSAGFETLATHDERLERADVEDYFLHPIADVVAHLTSRPVRFFLVRGPNAPERLYELKGEIRDQLGAPDKVHNLIHASDEGTEYHRLLGRFFPAFATPRYCNAADLDLRVPSRAAGEAALSLLDQQSNMRDVVLTIGRGQDELLPLARRPRARIEVAPAVALRFARAPRRAELLVHLAAEDDAGVVDELRALRDLDELTAWLAGRKRPVTACRVQVEPEEVARYATELRRAPGAVDDALARSALLADVERLRRAGVTRLGCFAPLQSLMQTELLGDVARLVGLYRGGGSSGDAAPGHFSVSYHCVGGTDLEDG